MILGRPDAILHVTTKRPRPDRLQPLGMIEKGEVLFDLDVPEVVPITDKRRVQLINQRRQFPFRWNFLVTAPPFDSQADILRSGILDNAPQCLPDPLQIGWSGGFPLLHCPNFFSDVFAGKKFSTFRQTDQQIGYRTDPDLPQMEHDERSAQAVGEIDCLKCLLDRALAVLWD